MKILFAPTMIAGDLTPQQRERILEAAGPGACLVTATDREAQRAEIVDADVLFGRVPHDVFLAARKLRLYASLGAGVDEVLKPELIESDVVLTSEKGSVGIHLAEHAFALLLGLTRGIHTAIRDQTWRSRLAIRRAQRELYEQTLGIVGLGGTGREVARRAAAFGMRVLAVDIEPVDPEPGVTLWKPDRLRDLLAESDVVVICTPLTGLTRRMFNLETFSMMKPSAILINVTRGEIVDGESLAQALDQGLIWGAGLDVTDPEPLPEGHPLWAHPRVIITPHAAGGSPRRADRAVNTFCENLRRLRDNRPLVAVIDKRKGY